MSYFARVPFMLTGLLIAGCASIPPGSEFKGPADIAPATVSVVETKEDRLYPVLYGTSRTANATGFSDDRDSQVHYGRVLVKIPKGHMTGSTGAKAVFPWQHDTALSIANIESSANQDAFVQMMKTQLKGSKLAGSEYVVVFIHGFNNTFESAAIRAAQIGADLDIPDNSMMFYSWAAQHDIDRYTVDEATVDASEVYLREFLRTVMRGAGSRKVHVIAHSMGNRALLRAVVGSLESVSAEQRIKFGQVILAAADIDRDLFAQLAPNYLKVAERTTIYLSPYDFAVHASELVHLYPRVGCGDAPQVTIPGIDNVVSLVPEDMPAHAYIAEALPLLVDIKNLFQRDVPERSSAAWKKQAEGVWTVGSPNPSWIAGRTMCKTKDTMHVKAN
ncbi:alpha/beta hydrolase [Rugamonas sp. A1-17]|nr:alpha/beta hydrolase [Rugamonas sp. A1-17]